MNDRMFTNKDLRAMIIPLFIEQFLLLLVGMADTFVVSFVGDAAERQGPLGYVIPRRCPP